MCVILYTGFVYNFNIYNLMLIITCLVMFLSVFVHNLGNKLRSRYSNKNVDTKATLNSSPVTKEHVPHIFNNLDNHDESGSSPLVITKRRADYDPHLMSASKRLVHNSEPCITPFWYVTCKLTILIERT